MIVIFVVQQIILVLAGKFLFGVDYLRNRSPSCLSSSRLRYGEWMGMLIGVAKNEDQVVLFSLIAMFLFTAWAVPGSRWRNQCGILQYRSVIRPCQAMQGFQNSSCVNWVWRQ
jgi:hypothetical protein